jgi:hypothetical protein
MDSFAPFPDVFGIFSLGGRSNHHMSIRFDLFFWRLIFFPVSGAEEGRRA